MVRHGLPGRTKLDDFVRSTAATRINAFVGGAGTRKELDALADDLGPSTAALTELRSYVK